MTFILWILTSVLRIVSVIFTTFLGWMLIAFVVKFALIAFTPGEVINMSKNLTAVKVLDNSNNVEKFDKEDFSN